MSTVSKRVLVLGGDGFCGWPTSLHLSALGHEIIIVDDLSRRKIDIDLAVESLTPIQPCPVRLQAWNELTGAQIRFRRLDVATQYHELHALIATEKPDAVVHFAQQRSAPYSMASAAQKRYTVSNNVNATNNLLAALVEARSNAHVVHLGSMGVYGYRSPVTTIPEGYVTVRIAAGGGTDVTQEILYPTNPESIYHMTKAQDQLLFAFYNKNDGLRVTDLHQGIVWGTQTEETRLDERLINRFDYDAVYGTVLNRFVMQAAVGHPLTVYGTGGQTRAFIHIQDTVRCIELALEHAPAPGERVRVVNQMSEAHRVRDLAARIAALTGADIAHVDNPRIEADENELPACNATLLKWGLRPVLLEDALLHDVAAIADKYAYRCDRSRIPCEPGWRTGVGR
jgi:UDP-sulfoquinovose synthase